MTRPQGFESGSVDHLPTWATKRCADCGELFLPGFSCVWTSRRPDEHTHGGLKYCQRQADYVTRFPEGLALEATLMEQAIVEAKQTLWRLVCEADPENWNDEVSSAVLSALGSLDRGYDAHKLVTFTPEAALNA